MAAKLIHAWRKEARRLLVFGHHESERLASLLAAARAIHRVVPLD
nr:hypothetical protein [Marinicella sp. W31]MDC2878333.1 hypothetical protein [Marinicella sp. W31]